ncbi:hypothetical protein AB0K18_00670 [Nonomuraea sp. NPDC049421]|uniref:hypothetical protein n=1 Tax=Nonomuraea sp. NPDC049421 TaxID=3155275 RepID=UPI00343FFF34
MRPPVLSGPMEIWINPACSKCRAALSVVIQRPITADDGTAVVARTEEAVRSVLPR